MNYLSRTEGEGVGRARIKLSPNPCQWKITDLRHRPVMMGYDKPIEQMFLDLIRHRDDQR